MISGSAQSKLFRVRVIIIIIYQSKLFLYCSSYIFAI